MIKFKHNSNKILKLNINYRIFLPNVQGTSINHTFNFSFISINAFKLLLFFKSLTFTNFSSSSRLLFSISSNSPYTDSRPIVFNH